ncbi:hypothetical protein INT48_001230 [Thamnidium elegans]|uniref:Uncharacterized protein n=1 Tax=Thamnidium elegans TaxID=101142 RepID=A0A8H7SJN2_9FUNG|nr:hypothetical protein INT48_001230 [Thamnidium elegans]
MNEKPALTPIMQPNATLTLESTAQNGTEPITVSPASSKKEPAKLQKQTITSSSNNSSVVVPILAQEETTTQKAPAIDLQKAPPVSSVTTAQLDHVINVPTMSSDQPIKQEIDLKKPSSSSKVVAGVAPVQSDKELCPTIVVPTTLNKEEPISYQHEPPHLSVTDPIPSLKSDDSSSIKQSSDVSKEQYYMESIKKDSNLMSLSDNTQQLFDELTATTPVLSDNVPTRLYNHERTSSTQPSIEETVPGLSPHPSSSVSRKSSIASQRSGLKGVFKSTLSKMSRKDSVRERPSSQVQPPLPQQQQQTMMLVTHDPIPSVSTSTKRSSRLSNFKLGRKKSVTSISSKKEQQQQQQQPADNGGSKKRSFSINVKNKIKSIVNKKSS